MQVKLKPIHNPLTLLKYVKQKGCFPNFTYDRAEDKMLSQLNILAQRYYQSLSINDKVELLKHERKMLFEEIQKPELTLARYYPQIKGMKISKQQKKNIEDYLTHLNLNAITRMVSLDRLFKSQQEKEEKEILIAASENINQASPIKDLLEEGFERVLSYYVPRQDKTGDIDNLQEKLIELNNDISQLELLQKMLIEAKPNEKEKEGIKELVNKILYSESSKPEILRYAVWGAGKYRSNEAFEKIKEIALNTEEQDIRKREFAIHSVAKYLREKTSEVLFIIETIQNEDSIFSPLARIINDKINGKYYSQKDRELNYYEFEPQEKEEFKNLRDKYYVLEKKPNIKNKNALDRNLIPFSYILNYLVTNKFSK